MTEENLADNPLSGVDEIAKYYFGDKAGPREIRRAYWLCESGLIPAFKLLGRSYLRPSATKSQISQLERRVAAS